MYTGNWENDLKEHQGTDWYANGAHYIGKFHAGMREGEGTYYYP